jgi:hypothetical protein
VKQRNVRIASTKPESNMGPLTGYMNYTRCELCPPARRLNLDVVEAHFKLPPWKEKTFRIDNRYPVEIRTGHLQNPKTNMALRSHIKEGRRLCNNPVVIPQVSVECM